MLFENSITALLKVSPPSMCILKSAPSKSSALIGHTLPPFNIIVKSGSLCISIAKTPFPSSRDVIKEAKEFRTMTLASIIKRPECNIKTVLKFIDKDYNKNVLENAETYIKYEGYISRYLNEIKDIEKYENMIIPKDFDYSTLQSVKIDQINKLKQFKPYNISQALRIPEIDMSVAHILILAINNLKKNKK